MGLQLKRKSGTLSPPLSTSIECRLGPAPLSLHLNVEWDYSWKIRWFFTYIKNGRMGPSLHLSMHLLNVDWDQPPPSLHLNVEWDHSWNFLLIKSGTLSPPVTNKKEMRTDLLNVDWDQPPPSSSLECRLGPAPLLLHLNVEWDYSWNFLPI